MFGGIGVAGGIGVGCDCPTNGVSQAKAVKPAAPASKKDMINRNSWRTSLAFYCKGIWLVGDGFTPISCLRRGRL